MENGRQNLVLPSESSCGVGTAISHDYKSLHLFLGHRDAHRGKGCSCLGSCLGKCAVEYGNENENDDSYGSLALGHCHGPNLDEEMVSSCSITMRCALGQACLLLPYETPFSAAKPRALATASAKLTLPELEGLILLRSRLPELDGCGRP